LEQKGFVAEAAGLPQIGQGFKGAPDGLFSFSKTVSGSVEAMINPAP
jgi:hypothetical protein